MAEQPQTSSHEIKRTNGAVFRNGETVGFRERSGESVTPYVEFAAVKAEQLALDDARSAYSELPPNLEVSQAVGYIASAGVNIASARQFRLPKAS